MSDSGAVRYLMGRIWGVEFLIRSGRVYHSFTSLRPTLLLLLLGGLLLGGRGLGGLGRLRLSWGLGRGQCLLGGLLSRGLLLLGVGGECGRAAGDVDILAIVGHVLQGELGAVAGTQAHGAGSQGGCSLAHFWGEERQSGGMKGEEGMEKGMKLVRQQEFEGLVWLCRIIVVKWK